MGAVQQKMKHRKKRCMVQIVCRKCTQHHISCPYIWRCGTEIRMCGRTESHRKTPSFHIYRILIIVSYTGAAGSFLRHDVRIPCVNRINRPEVLSLLFSSLSFAVVHLLS